MFRPTGCQLCDHPPCLEVGPSTATRKRADGSVTLDEDLCIGCGYCLMACPYDARALTAAEAARRPVGTGVASKCDFCAGRIDAGRAHSLTPGRDPEATPLCVNSCISGALRFGDLDDPHDPVASLLAEHQWFRLHEDQRTGPGFYYLWDAAPP